MSEKGVAVNRTARILAAVLAVVLVGIGLYVAYDFGFDAGAVAASAGDNGTILAVGRGYGWHGGFGFFPFFWFFPLLILFLIFGAFRRGPRWGYGPGFGPREEMERRLEEWHRKAHEQS
jgi:hypothetical protein